MCGTRVDISPRSLSSICQGTTKFSKGMKEGDSSCLCYCYLPNASNCPESTLCCCFTLSWVPLIIITSLVHIWGHGCALRADFGTRCSIFWLFLVIFPLITPTKCIEMSQNHSILTFHPLIAPPKISWQFHAHFGPWLRCDSWFWQQNAPYFGLFWCSSSYYYLPNASKRPETTISSSHEYHQRQLAVSCALKAVFWEWERILAPKWTWFVHFWPF